MQNRLRLTVTLFMFAITSCVMAPISLKERESLEIVIKKSLEAPKTLCDPFVFPELQQIPPVPELTEEQLKDPLARDKVFIDAIGELRNVIQEDRNRLEQALKKHHESCQR